MFEFILDVIFLIWIGNKFGYGVAVAIAAIEVIILFALIHSESMDEWKAHLNRTEYWKKKGPYR